MKYKYIKEAALNRGLNIEKYLPNVCTIKQKNGSTYILRYFKDIYEVEVNGQVLFTSVKYTMALNYIQMKIKQEVKTNRNNY